MYDFTFEEIQFPLIISIAIIFLATMLAVLHWEQNTQKLKKLYAQKIFMINNIDIETKEEAKQSLSTNSVHKKKK